MKLTVTTIALVIMFTGSAIRLPAKCVPGTEVSSQDDRSASVGEWVKESGDSGGEQRIILVLRADGSYRKTLDATVGGRKYGGTHEGTWTAEGKIVDLSGDGNWPAFSHDLSEFRKIR